MDWRDEGVLLGVRRHGESAAILDVLTAAHGRHTGLVRGARSKGMAAVLQPGAQLSLEWKARLAEHLGHYTVDLVAGRAGGILSERDRLAGLNAMCGLLSAFLPEREPEPELYTATVGLADGIAGTDPGWGADYARWEALLLATLGFGLDLSRCASTGETDELVYVSPRTGRAVSRAAGAEWADRLLALPSFLGAGGAPADETALHDALTLTGWFLTHRACPAVEREALPESRTRFADIVARRARAARSLAPDRPIG